MSNTSKSLLLFVLLAGAVAVLPWLGHDEHASAPQSQATGAPEPHSDPVFTRPTSTQPVMKPLAHPPPGTGTPASRAPGAPRVAPHNTQKPEGNIIEFRVVDGLAIAYGDLILGKVESSQATKGFHEAPNPLLWERPEIPYAISPELPDPPRVEAALKYFEQHTPLRFVAYSGQKDAIVFEPGQEHCFSVLGRVGGLQPIKLSAGCGTQEILHEVMHALGFVHEQSRPDRDSYVEVLWDNIDEKYHSQFAMVPEGFMEALKGSRFNHRSIMLYKADSFALKPGTQSLKARGAEPIAPARQGLSEEDLRRIRRLYDPYEPRA